MKSIFTSLAFCSVAMLSYGASWNAKLMDATCASSGSAQKTSAEKLAKTCAPTSATANFAVEAGGKTYTLDAKGNEMAVAAMKNGSIKPDKDGDVHVKVNGTAQGNTIKVDSLNGGKEHD